MSIFFDYLYWHYFVAPKGILGLLRNYTIGAWHQFLVGRHFRTLFSPWHRVQPSDIGEKKTIGDKIMNGIIDFYIRILAAIVRSTIIISGLVYEVVLIIAFTALYIIWLLWPVIVLIMVARGINILR